MIYRLPRYDRGDDPLSGFAFVHIPRTAGTSITHALAARCEDALVDVFAHKHEHAPTIAARFRSGKEWWASFRFSVIRSPWAIIESDYRHTMHAFEALHPAARLECSLEWWLRMHRVAAYRDFAEFVREEYLADGSMLRRGGFWRTWCLGPDGDDLGVQPFRFERLQAEWLEITEAIGLGPQPELPWLNRTLPCSPAPLLPCSPSPLLPRYSWTPALVDAVGERCEGDLVRFGYERPCLAAI